MDQEVYQDGETSPAAQPPTPAGIGIGLAIVAGWFYLGWLPSQQKYLDARNFRLLTTLNAPRSIKEKCAMKKIAFLILLVAIGVLPAFAVSPDIVYVSYSGSDTHPCTRSAPCKTITYALSVVAAGGHVDVVGSGTYDTFTITKSITVEAEPGVVATIDVPSSGTGITVEAGSSDVVTVRNLYLRGTQGALHGILITTGGLINVEDCVSDYSFHALTYTANSSGNLSVKGGSYNGIDTGIFLCCASGASYTATIDGVHVYGGSYAGVNADGTNITITRSFLTGNGTTTRTSGAGIRVVHGTAVMENDIISAYGYGVLVDDTGYISFCTITDNGAGVSLGFIGRSSFGTAYSRGNNTIVNNGMNVNGTLTPFSPL